MYLYILKKAVVLGDKNHLLLKFCFNLFLPNLVHACVVNSINSINRIHGNFHEQKMWRNQVGSLQILWQKSSYITEKNVMQLRVGQHNLDYVSNLLAS